MPEYAERYRVSDVGEVYSIKSAKVLRPVYHGDGYPMVTLYDGRGGHCRTTIHKLVTAAFIGPRPSDCTVDHVDNDKTNNAVENLRYISRAQNTSRAHKQGRVSYPGNCDNRRKLTPELVANLRRELEQLPLRRGEKKKLAEKYGISPYTLTQIERRRAWKNVP